MDRHEAKEIVKSRYADLLQPAKVKGTYVCPLCGNGTGKDGDGLRLDPNRKDEYKLHCFRGGCDFDGDVIALYQQKHGCDFKTALDDLCGKLGIIVDEHEPRRADIKPARASRRAETREEQQEAATDDFTDYYRQCRANMTETAAQEYLSYRGISPETAARFWIGYDPAKRILVIPASASYYTTRSVDKTATGHMRFKNNPRGAKVELFNAAALYEGDKPAIITESSIDAISIMEAGGVAVGLNGAGNVKLLLETLEDQPTEKRFIIGLDNDEAGEKAARKLCDGLDALQVRFCKFNLYGEHHDANDALRSNRGALAASVVEAERAAAKPDNMADYIVNGGMFKEAEKLQDQRHRKTGFANLDAEAGAIYSGLYTIGGISSVGKTSFISQLADQMAAQGHHVIFFSLEQSRLELASKSISRLTAINDVDTARTALQIRLHDYDDFSSVDQQIANYLNSVGERISVVEGNFNCTVGYIRQYVADYMEANGVKPVVFIDYLQVLQADVDPATGRRITDKRIAVDYNVTEIKRMSRNFEIPVFVVSSFNRGSYLAPVDFEAFKESGGIEYTSDVVWGLQLSVISDKELFEKDDNKDKPEKRKILKAAKEKIPRDVELVCLKNRYGASHYSCQFTYYPQFDYFTPKPAR